MNNTALSWAHFNRQDIPVHFGIAEAWTVGDMYQVPKLIRILHRLDTDVFQQEGVIAATEPNRVTWMSGSINCPGGPQTPDQGGTVLDNNGTPGTWIV